MNKENAKQEVYNQYTSLVNGAITYTIDNVDYVIANGKNALSNLTLTSKAMTIKSLTTSNISTINHGLILVDKIVIDNLINQMIIVGYDAWCEKNDRQSKIDNAETEAEIQAIVDMAW